MIKKTIFLSHIAEEGRLDTVFKNRLEKDFLSLVDVFVSSDSRSIPPGDAWLKAVDEHLDRAAALIVLASPTSVARPWVTFEAGAGWAKKVPTMILCHSGIAPRSLPLPIGQLQAFLANDLDRMYAMYGVIAGILGSSIPESDLGTFIGEIEAFEREYTEERDILSALREIRAVEPKFIQWLRQQLIGSPVSAAGVSESWFRRVEPALDRLKNGGLLTYNFATNGIAFATAGSSGGGNFGNLLLTITPKLNASLKHNQFN